MAYTKIEHYDEEITSALTGKYKESLDLLGEDASREGTAEGIYLFGFCNRKE